MPGPVLRSRNAVAAVAGAIGLTLGGGLAYAAIPHSTTKVISACYGSNGALRVIDTQAGARCAASETPLSWNQQGRKGLQWRGAFSATRAYVTDDAVLHAGSAWIAVRPSTGVTPGSDATRWGMLASRGARGPGRIFYAQQQDEGPLPLTFTFANVPAGNALIRVEGTAYRSTGGRGWLEVGASPAPGCLTQSVRYPTLYFNLTQTHMTLTPMEWPVCFAAAGERSVTLSTYNLSSDENDFYTVTIEVFAD